MLPSAWARVAPPVLDMAFSEHPPWKVLDQDNQPGGIDIKCLGRLAHRLGPPCQCTPFPLPTGASPSCIRDAAH